MAQRKSDWMVIVVRWTARVIGSAYAVVLLLFVVGSIFEPGSGGSPSFGEWIKILLMPIGVSVGLILAWKWEGLGGLITILCLFVWHLLMKIQTGSYEFLLFVDATAIPALLFLLVWLVSKRRAERKT